MKHLQIDMSVDPDQRAPSFQLDFVCCTGAVLVAQAKSAVVMEKATNSQHFKLQKHKEDVSTVKSQ